MSFDHKAFAFRWSAFEVEFRPILMRGLAAADPRSLRAWCLANEATLSDPYEGAPLEGRWEEQLLTKDVQEYGDFALTKFYDASENFGLGAGWPNLDLLLPQPLQTTLTGHPLVGDFEQAFDPGRMGSYFQTEHEVAESATLLLRSDIPGLVEFGRALQTRCVTRGLGLYATF